MVHDNNHDLRETALSPEVRRIRNSIIKKFVHEPLDTMAKFVKDIVDNEEDTVKRLGAMAARVEILRMRIAQISEMKSKTAFDDIEDDDTEEHTFEEGENEIVITSPNLSDWVRLRIIENSEINGVRFPKGVVIDVSQEDGDRLLESGKATYVNEDEIADVKSDLNLQKEIEEKASKAKKEAGETKIESVMTNKEPGNESSETASSVEDLADLSSDDVSSLGVNNGIAEKDNSKDDNGPLEKEEKPDKVLAEAESAAEPQTEKSVVEKKVGSENSEVDTKDVKTEEIDEDEKKAKPADGIETFDDKQNTASQKDSADDLLAGFDLDQDETKKSKKSKKSR